MSQLFRELGKSRERKIKLYPQTQTQKKIQLRNLRNYSGEQFYKNLPIRNPIALMQHFRHKKLETTMHYIRVIVIDYEEDEQYISQTSTTLEKDAGLIENGFQYVTERDGTKLFRKRK